MTDKYPEAHEYREAYIEMIELIEDAGYTVNDEEFKSNKVDPEFKATLWIAPPDGNQN